MIKLQVIGNLGKDCMVNMVNGKNVINFSVAHTEKYRDSSGVSKEKTTWVECAYWTDRTGIAPYLKKGQQVFVEGTPEIRTFTRNDGTTGASLSLRVQLVQLVGKIDTPTGEGANMQNSSASQQNSYQSQAPVAGSSDMGMADDLPF
ncbi:MAG: single-stranded DNA-binding protein [Chitinophagaceae bacterium]|jgi:single-strand DNA-binding protein|nr:single-stranded DNA-binding protein [Chitinophagaceae bacterium]